jgi:hypothetical protein
MHLVIAAASKKRVEPRDAIAVGRLLDTICPFG